MRETQRIGNTVLGVLAVCALLLMGPLSAQADQVTTEYDFERPEMETVRHSGEVFDRIVMPGTPNAGRTGQPALPASGADILIPYGHEVVSVEIVTGEKVLIGSGYNIEPNLEPIPLSSPPGTVVYPEPDATIYHSDLPFPEGNFEQVGVYGFRGFQILTLRLQPVQYLPLSGELYYYPQLKVIVHTEDVGRSSALLRGLEVDEQEVMQRVDNPETVNSYWMATSRWDRSYDLLIITTPALAASFQPLKDYHDTTGILTEIHTTDDVGSSSPDDVRDYIRDKYLTDGIQYVIIGADDDIIPAKDLYVVTSAGGYTEYNMPGDIYFACLDGVWNYDGDGQWGEPNDGDGGGDVDLVAEVYVGRAAAGNSTEVDRFVTKTLWYLTGQHSTPQNVQLVGEHLGFGGPSEYAAETLDELIDGADTHGYTTVGIPSDQYSVDRLYDRDWPGNDWPRSELSTRVNNGVHILNHLGHGSEQYAMKFTNSQVLADWTNTDLCFIYSQTCLAGHLDGLDCWAEATNIKMDYGAFAVIMNARYGFGAYSSTDGPSQRFNREFFDAVFNTAEGKPEIGKANHDSKEDNLYRISDGCMRWCYYELNLFGDPTVPISGVTAVAFNYPNGVPETVLPGEPTTFEVEVYGVGDGVPVPGTGELHYSINGSMFNTVSMTVLGENYYEATLPPINCGDVLSFYVSAEEVVNGIFYNPSPANPNTVMAATGIITVFQDDFEIDKGWSISGGLWARGVPTGNGGEYGGPDPSSGCVGPNVFGYNLNGDYENSMPEYHLTSPPINCSGLSSITLRFQRWLGVEQPTYDHAYIRISTDGANWVTIWDNNGTITDGSWVEMEFDISEYADNEPTVYLRWTMGSTDSGWRYCGWNIDGVEVIGMECDENRPHIITETLPDWTESVAYSQQLMAEGGSSALFWTDKNGDLVGTGLTLSGLGLLSGIPTTAGPISFTAHVVDKMEKQDEQLLSFTINPAVEITSASLPDWTMNCPYSQQLTATGGTGDLTWEDKNDGLSGKGLTLSPEGLLSGTPSVSGPVDFIAEASDQVGSQDEQPFDFTINDELVITTQSLPPGVVGEPYSRQLGYTGGTGTISWNDLNGDLDGSGLTLSSDGILSGTPPAEITVGFTANASDGCGASSQQPLTVEISPAYTCGDLNDDGEIADIADLVYLVDYMFTEGPPPIFIQSADFDGDDEITIADLVFLVDYMFNSGPPPEC